MRMEIRILENGEIRHIHDLPDGRTMVVDPEIPNMVWGQKTLGSQTYNPPQHFDEELFIL